MSYYITNDTYSLTASPLEFVTSVAIGSLLPLTCLLARQYLTWGAGLRMLQSREVVYEEESWAEGYVFQKPLAVHDRDRLIAFTQVVPIVTRIKAVLAAVAFGLIVSSTLYCTAVAHPDSHGRSQVKQPHVSPDGSILFSSSVTSLEQVRMDDDAAAREQAALGGVPGFCYNRVYRAQMGESLCAKFDR